MLAGQRVGLVSHPAAVLPDLTHAMDALLAGGVNLAALFAPEHGFWGFEADAAAIEDTVEPRCGLPAYSLYGNHLEPDEKMLKNVDILVFDMQDVGARFYTFISTLYYLLKSAGCSGKRVLVLDRPNPLGGNRVAGPAVARGFESFVGIAPLPVLHGLTVGEVARWMNARCGLGAEVKVEPMRGWRREMRFEQTGLPWVPTSPGIPQLSTVHIYPCTCLLEGTNLSEGRGTPLPFEVIGAPWLDGVAMAFALNCLSLPGVRFRPVLFKPVESKWAGQVCQGVQVHLIDLDAFQPLRTGLHLLRYLLDEAPEFEFLTTSWEGTQPHFDLLMGGDEVRRRLVKGAAVEEIISTWAEFEQAFRAEREPFLLYT